jgi:hypothetical protein
MYRAWFSLRSPARDSQWRMTWPLEASRSRRRGRSCGCARRTAPAPGGQLGRHVQHLFTVTNPELAPDRYRGRPPPLSSVAASALPTGAAAGSYPGGRDALLAQQPAVLVERGGSVGSLVRVDADHYRHAGAFLEDAQEHRRGQADFAQSKPLLSHSRSGADRTAQPFLSRPEGGSGGSGATCRHPGPTGCRPRLLPAIQ